MADGLTDEQRTTARAVAGAATERADTSITKARDAILKLRGAVGLPTVPRRLGMTFAIGDEPAPAKPQRRHRTPFNGRVAYFPPTRGPRSTVGERERTPEEVTAAIAEESRLDAERRAKARKDMGPTPSSVVTARAGGPLFLG